jgi:hypothetical protein
MCELLFLTNRGVERAHAVRDVAELGVAEREGADARGAAEPLVQAWCRVRESDLHVLTD